MVTKVRCSTCNNEDGGRCVKKGSKVSTNKKRRCLDFVLNKSKVRLTEELPSVRVPYNEKEEIKKAIKEAKLRSKRLPESSSVFPTEIPEADDLSMFKNNKEAKING